MSMRLITGTYRVLGSAPDGDSIRFYPDNPNDWDLVSAAGQYAVRRNSAGGAQLRLDGIDALETHYPTIRGVVHQPWEYARRAAGQLLDWIGFTDVTRNPDETVTAATPPQIRGYLLSRGADRNGRCVSFAGKGEPPGRSGDRIFMDVELLRQSANHHQLATGVAFPTFYRKLFPDLRQDMTATVADARAGAGLWPLDLTTKGAELPNGIESLTASVVILPKLFRRLVDFLVLDSGPDDEVSLAGFPDYLSQRDDRIFLLPDAHWTSLDTVVRVEEHTVRLTTEPEYLIFQEA